MPSYLGNTEITGMHIGSTEINEAYLGEYLVYSKGPFVGLKLRPDSTTFNTTKRTAELKIQSSEDWTLTFDNGGNEGLVGTFSQSSGTAGKYTVVLSISFTDAPLLPFSVTASATIAGETITRVCSCDYVAVDYNSALHITGNKAFRFLTDYIPNTDTKIDIRVYPETGTDDTWYAILHSSDQDTFDGCVAIRTNAYNDCRPGCWGHQHTITGNIANRFHHMILENGKFTDNGTEYTWTPAPQQSGTTPLFVGAWFKRSGNITRSWLGYYGVIEIFEGNTLVRRYIPAEDVQNTPCYYETESGQYVYADNPGNDTITLTQFPE